jgi:hypothetical protein
MESFDNRCTSQVDTERDYWYETDNISCVIRELDIIAQTYRAKLIYD